MPAQKQPNILFIMADDIGWFNVSAYNLGIMGYRTPNIDRIAKEGALFTDFYGQQSCTAGRAAFITGQSPIRTGLTKVGLPGATLGLSAEDPTIAQFLKQLGYATGQFGKNHLGDRNEFLPTVHGFDEFFGNLYHLNAEEEPENPDYPKDPAFRKKFGPRGVLRCKATDKDDTTIDAQFGKVGKQTIENTGPLTQKADGDGGRGVRRRRARLHGSEDEGRQAVVLLHEHHAHAHLHASQTGVRRKDGTRRVPRRHGRAGRLRRTTPRQARRAEGRRQHDRRASPRTTAPRRCRGRMAARSPFRGEKATNFEGGWRIPFVMRWPGVIEPGRVINDICSLQDMIPTFAAAAGEPDLVEKVKKGYAADGKTFKVHLDGVNLLPFLKGEVDKSSARGLPLLERRRRAARRASRPLESHVPRAARSRPRGVARAVLGYARAQDLQSAHRSVRGGRREFAVL